MLVQFLAVKAEIDACLTVSRFLPLLRVCSQKFKKNAKLAIFDFINIPWYSGTTEAETLLFITINNPGFSQNTT